AVGGALSAGGNRSIGADMRRWLTEQYQLKLWAARGFLAIAVPLENMCGKGVSRWYIIAQAVGGALSAGGNRSIGADMRRWLTEQYRLRLRAARGFPAIAVPLESLCGKDVG
ncbi:MAG: hypothetical protein ACOYIH_04560, partial [Candidatus Fimadaptatus sp.]